MLFLSTYLYMPSHFTRGMRVPLDFGPDGGGFHNRKCVEVKIAAIVCDIGLLVFICRGAENFCKEQKSY